MKPASFFAALSGLLLTGTAASAASQPANDDTIVVKLPNQVSMTIVARDKKQLRELKAYKLDSLMLMLDTYISRAEAAGSKSGNGQVTMEFYPAKDKPQSQAAPEQVRVTVRGAQTGANKVEVKLAEKAGVKLEDAKDSDEGFRITINTKNDSVKHVGRTKHRHHDNKLTGSDFGVDLGLNALVNRETYAPDGTEQAYDLRPWGSRYAALSWKFWARAGKQSPLYFHLGPEIAFNNYMLEGNRYFAQDENRTNIVVDPVRNLEKSKLSVTTLNLPVGFTLKFRDANNGHDELFRLGAGGFVGYRVGAHTKLKYESEGRARKDKDRGGYNLEDFQYGVTGTVGVRGFDLFVKYNLNDVFKDNRGPKAQTVSFGITLSDI